jgi:hypothetical protein
VAKRTLSRLDDDMDPFANKPSGAIDEISDRVASVEKVLMDIAPLSSAAGSERRPYSG